MPVAIPVLSKSRRQRPLAVSSGHRPSKSVHTLPATLARFPTTSKALPVAEVALSGHRILPAGDWVTCWISSPADNARALGAFRAIVLHHRSTIALYLQLEAHWICR